MQFWNSYVTNTPSKLYSYWTYPSLWRALQRILSFRSFTSTSSPFNSHKEKRQVENFHYFLKKIIVPSHRLYQCIRFFNCWALFLTHAILTDDLIGLLKHQGLLISIWKHGSDFHHHRPAKDQLPQFGKGPILKHMNKYQFVKRGILGKFYFNVC